MALGIDYTPQHSSKTLEGCYGRNGELIVDFEAHKTTGKLFSFRNKAASDSWKDDSIPRDRKGKILTTVSDEVAGKAWEEMALAHLDYQNNILAMTWAHIHALKNLPVLDDTPDGVITYEMIQAALGNLPYEKYLPRPEDAPEDYEPELAHEYVSLIEYAGPMQGLSFVFPYRNEHGDLFPESCWIMKSWRGIILENCIGAQLIGFEDKDAVDAWYVKNHHDVAELVSPLSVEDVLFPDPIGSIDYSVKDATFWMYAALHLYGDNFMDPDATPEPLNMVQMFYDRIKTKKELTGAQDLD